MADVSALTQAGPWRLTQQLGCNGVAATYVGSREDGAPRAVVVLDAAHLADPQLPARQALPIKALMGGQASRLVAPVDFGEADGLVYCAYEKIKGTHLGNRVREEGLPSAARSLEIVKQVIEGLQVLGNRGEVHRVITPASIFINEIEQVKLLHAGWGPLLLGVKGGAAHPAFMSNLPFLAPEICAGEPGDEAADVYSLGANLYFLLCGAPTHWMDDPAALAQRIATTPVDLAPLQGLVGQEVIGLVQELLELDPEDRPLNLEALHERLDTLAGKLYEVAEEPLHPVAPPTQPLSATAPLEPEEPAPAPAPLAPPAMGAGAPMGAAPPAFEPPPTYQPPPPGDAPQAPQIPAPSPSSPPTPRGPAPAPAAPAQRPAQGKAKAKGGGLPMAAKLGIGGAVALVFAIGTFVVLTMVLGKEEPAPTRGSAGPAAQPTPERAPRPEQERAKLEPWIVTVEKLAAAADINRRFLREVGRYPLRDLETIEEDIRKEGLAEADITDGWGSILDFRQQWVFSAGPDKQWNTADDLYVDTKSGLLSAMAPSVRLPEDDETLVKWNELLAQFQGLRSEAFKAAEGAAARSGDSGVAPAED